MGGHALAHSGSPARHPRAKRGVVHRRRRGHDLERSAVPISGLGARTRNCRERHCLSTQRKAADLLPAGCWGSDDVALGRTLASLRGQNRTVWEVVIYGASATRRDQPSFAALLVGDKRIIVADGVRETSADPACALHEARGDFVAVIEAGDLLSAAALDEIAAALTEAPQADIFYSDEDHRSEGDMHARPYLKPGWSPDLLYTFNYFGRLTLLRRELALEAGGFDERAGAAFEWDLNLRVSDAAQTIVRIPKVLCHRRPRKRRRQTRARRVRSG